MTTATATHLHPDFRHPFLIGGPFGDVEVVCELGHPYKPWCRVIEGGNGLVAQTEIASGTRDYARAGKNYGEIFRRMAARQLVGKDDLVLAWTGDEFMVGRYQGGTGHGQHTIETLNGDSFQTKVFEPYHFERRERVWAKVAFGRWVQAYYVRRATKDGRKGYRVELSESDRSVVVFSITHRDDPKVLLSTD